MSFKCTFDDLSTDIEWGTPSHQKVLEFKKIIVPYLYDTDLDFYLVGHFIEQYFMDTPFTTQDIDIQIQGTYKTLDELKFLMKVFIQVGWNLGLLIDPSYSRSSIYELHDRNWFSRIVYGPKMEVVKDGEIIKSKNYLNRSPYTYLYSNNLVHLLYPEPTGFMLKGFYRLQEGYYKGLKVNILDF